MLWRKRVTAIASEFPDVELSHMYVDNASKVKILIIVTITKRIQYFVPFKKISHVNSSF